MSCIRDIFGYHSKLRYMEVGFNEQQAQALSWLSRQKSNGRLVGAATGLFLAYSWGHWHHRILSHFRVRFSPRITQLAIFISSFAAMDFIFTGNRKGANELFANNTYLNNNLFMANMESLAHNFSVLNRKFTPEEIQAFQFKRNLQKTKFHKIENKKWIYNENIHTPETFAKRIQQATVAPWKNKDVQQKLRAEGTELTGPTNIGKLLDSSGEKLGIIRQFVFGWSPLH